jgi:hypothetical protein
MKLIYSLHIGKNRDRNGEFCGFRNKEDMLNCLLLSAVVSSKHFSSCELYCDSEAVDLIKEDGRPFPFTNMYTCFDELNDWLMPHNWAYAKILTYTLQDEPFLHLDFDAVLWDGVPPPLLSKKFFFYQKETITGKLHTYYTPMYATAKAAGLLPKKINYFPGFAFNMGLFGCTSGRYFPFIKRYAGIAKEYVIKQQEHATATGIFDDQCILFEQLFITNLIIDEGWKEGIDYDSYVSSDFKNKFTPAYRLSHFIASWKRNEGVNLMIRKQLIDRGLEKRRPRVSA